MKTKKADSIPKLAFDVMHAARNDATVLPHISVYAVELQVKRHNAYDHLVKSVRYHFMAILPEHQARFLRDPTVQILDYQGRADSLELSTIPLTYLLYPTTTRRMIYP